VIALSSQLALIICPDFRHAWTHPDNLASQAVAERAAFARRGESRCDTPFRDGSTVGILFETR
jgi:hypothetical protein